VCKLTVNAWQIPWEEVAKLKAAKSIHQIQDSEE
jgi:hypothetical protein